MKKLILPILILILIPSFSHATTVYYTENFNDYEFGTIDAQGDWETLDGSGNHVTSTDYMIYPVAGFWNSLQINYDDGYGSAYWNFEASSTYVYIELTYMPVTVTNAYAKIWVYNTDMGGFDIALYPGEAKNHNGDSLCTLNSSYNKIYLEADSVTHDVKIKCNAETNWNTATFTWDGAPTGGGFKDMIFSYGIEGSPPSGDIEAYFDDITILTSTSSYAYSSECYRYYNDPVTCEEMGCHWLEFATATTTEDGTTTTLYTGRCVSEDVMYRMEYEDAGLLVDASITTSTVPWIDWEKSDIKKALGDKIPFGYIFVILDGLNYLAQEMDPTEDTLEPISLTIPTVYGTGTHATTLIMSTFDIPIIDQEWIFKVLPEDTWHQIRTLLSAVVTITLFFGLKTLLKQIRKPDSD